MTPKMKYWLLAANSTSGEYGEQIDKKENEILQNHWLQMQLKDEDNEEGGGGEQEPWEDEEHSKQQQEEDKPQDGTNAGGVLIWGPP